jgi:L-aminopeptidase/D-esterase-like protein
MITTIDGILVGHWSSLDARTGCTVAILPPGTVASGDVRGGAPATREWALLEPGRLVEHVDAVVLTGGSAFGLAAADGVMQWLEGEGRGFSTSVGPVPIVVAMGLFDLGVGDPTVRPDAEAGRQACAVAGDAPVALGPVGAGTGATTGKWHSHGAATGGLCGAVRRHGELVVASLFAVNALGSPDDGTAPGLDPDDLATAGWLATVPEDSAVRGFGSTTIGIVATNARLTKAECLHVAQGGHDGLARSLLPAHTKADGDAIVAVATGAVEASAETVRQLAVTVVADAVRSLQD